jgi:hypothetical protein
MLDFDLDTAIHAVVGSQHACSAVRLHQCVVRQLNWAIYIINSCVGVLKSSQTYKFFHSSSIIYIYKRILYSIGLSPTVLIFFFLHNEFRII